MNTCVTVLERGFCIRTTKASRLGCRIPRIVTRSRLLLRLLRGRGLGLVSRETALVSGETTLVAAAVVSTTLLLAATIVAAAVAGLAVNLCGCITQGRADLINLDFKNSAVFALTGLVLSLIHI